VFLPFANNEKSSNASEFYRQGFQKLKKLVLIGGPDDGVITPWQSR
jgi:palmitoyl-protein thioesterase